ncbi:MAG: carboxy terminal-processing peptidase [Opitutaceae bacterium]
MNRRLSTLLLLGAAAVFAFRPALASQVTPPTAFATTPLMVKETTRMVRFLESFHFQGRELTNDDFRQLIPDFMGELDAHRMFYLATDRDQLTAQFGERLAKDLRYLGNIDAAYDAFRIYRERVAARVTWINLELDQPIDFAAAEEFRWDRSKAEWPTTIDEANTLWRQRLKFELLQDLLNDKTGDQAKALDSAKDKVRKRYDRLLKSLDEFGSEEIQEIYLTTLAAMYDPHTAYMSPSTLDDFNMQMRLKLIGIGAQLSEEDGVCTIRELIPGGPADVSKQLHPNDKIMSVAQGPAEFVDVVGMKLRKVVQLIRGDKGTTVRLLVQPADATDPSVRREIVIVRDEVKLNDKRARATLEQVPSGVGDAMLPIGVIELPAFYGANEEEDGAPGVSATKDVEELLRKLIAAGAKGIVLDLRRNGGGLLSEAVDLTGLFIAQGPVVQVKDSIGRVEVRSDENPRTVWNGPLAVLTSRYSASASEIVAGALQNYGRAIVIGDNSTHGKGTVQTVIPVLEESRFQRFLENPPRSGATKITIQKFYLPNGASTQNRGVVSDIVLPSIEEFLPIGESDLPHALAWDTIRTTRFEGSSLDGRFVELLRERSKRRQETLEEFSYLRRNIERFRQFDERKTVSLNLEARKAQKKDDDAFRDAAKKERLELAKQNYASTDVNLDNVEPTPEPVTPPAKNDDDTEDDESTDPKAKIDVHLRESLRVLSDAITLWPQPQLWAQAAQPPVALNQRNGFAPIP